MNQSQASTRPENDLESMADAFDRVLLQVLEKGREVLTKDGELIRVEPSAADLNVIRQRLKDCGITSVGTANNPIGNLVKEMQIRGMTLPPVGDEEDAATA